MPQTFPDAGVLFHAFRGGSDLSRRALALLADPDRTFLSSVFLELETLPKAVHFRHLDEEQFLRRFFASARRVELTPEIQSLALKQACECGLGAMDALHVAAAAGGGADELVTAERSASSIYRATAVRVVPLASVAIGRTG